MKIMKLHKILSLLMVLVFIISLMPVPVMADSGTVITVGAGGDYTTVTAALAAAADGDTVNLLETINESVVYTVTADKTITINGNGHNLVAVETAIEGVSSVALTLNGTGVIQLKNISLEGNNTIKGDMSFSMGLYVTDTAMVNVKSLGGVIAFSNKFCSGSYGVRNDGASTISIDQASAGGNINTPYSFAVYNEGSGTVNVGFASGSFSPDVSYGIYNFGTGIINANTSESTGAGSSAVAAYNFSSGTINVVNASATGNVNAVGVVNVDTGVVNVLNARGTGNNSQNYGSGRINMGSDLVKLVDLKKAITEFSILRYIPVAKTGSTNIGVLPEVFLNGTARPWYTDYAKSMVFSGSTLTAANTLYSPDYTNANLPVVTGGNEVQTGTAIPASSNGDVVGVNYSVNVGPWFADADNDLLTYRILSATDSTSTDVTSDFTIFGDVLTYVPNAAQGSKTVTAQITANDGIQDSANSVTLSITVGAEGSIAAAVGDYVTFGNQKAPIKWRVVETGNNELFLLTDSTVGNMNFSNDDEIWSTSYIRSWLRNDFLVNRFTDAEIQSIKEITTETDVTDNVFLLSKDEWTAIAARNITDIHPDQFPIWWMRSSYGGDVYVKMNNKVSLANITEMFDVRPAVKLNTAAYKISSGTGASTNPFVLTALTLPDIKMAGLLEATVGTAYITSCFAFGSGPITWSVTGNLPAGLTLSSDGVISGTPTTAGTSTFTLNAQNSVGIVSKIYSIVVKTAQSNSNPGGDTPTPPPASTTPPVTVPITPPTTSPETVVTVTEAKNDTNGKAAATVTESQVTDALKKAEDTQGKVEIKVTSAADAKTVEISMPQKAFKAASDSKITALTVSTALADITFDDATLANITKDIAGDVKIAASKVDVSTLTDETQKSVGDRPVFNFSVTSGDKTISNFGGNVTVSIPYTLKAGEDTNAIVIYYINAEGKLETVSNCAYDVATGKITFTTNHFSQYAVGYNEVTFKDVAPSASYYNAVRFIAARGITSGNGEGTFGPNVGLTRSQLLVMVMKAYGISPDTTGTNNFIDAGNTYYTGYLAAAKRLGISAGIGNNLFAPEKPITRQEMAILLFNTLKQLDKVPAQSKDQSIASYKDSSLVAQWAVEPMTLFVETGAIKVEKDMLYPTRPATRAEMALALYQLMSN